MLEIVHYHQLMDDIENWVCLGPEEIEKHIELTLSYQEYVKNEKRLSQYDWSSLAEMEKEEKAFSFMYDKEI